MSMWLIRKNGYFYRPKSCGYTASIYEAGIYTQAEAEAEARIEDSITAHPLSEFKTQAQADLDNAKRILAYLGDSQESAQLTSGKREP